MRKLRHRAKTWHACVIATLAACGSANDLESKSESPAMTVPASAGAATEKPAMTKNAGAAGAAGGGAVALSTGGTAGASAGSAAPAQMRTQPAGAAGSLAAASGDDAGVANPTDPTLGSDGTIPCAPYKALAHACHSCHGKVPANGAPMSLVTIMDFHILSVQKEKIPKYELARMRVDGSRRPIMPPGGAISDEDKQALLEWLNREAPAASADEPGCS